ncbi:MAG: hypothetical protein QNJ31_08435 [Candidatus Caenarcaniphilales bacterium]|nr:hypothetical protein [Candidatus Caenarcaniphilales bacterium]
MTYPTTTDAKVFDITSRLLTKDLGGLKKHIQDQGGRVGTTVNNNSLEVPGAEQGVKVSKAFMVDGPGTKDRYTAQLTGDNTNEIVGIVSFNPTDGSMVQLTPRDSGSYISDEYQVTVTDANGETKIGEVKEGTAEAMIGVKINDSKLTKETVPPLSRQKLATNLRPLTGQKQGNSLFDLGTNSNIPARELAAA